MRSALDDDVAVCRSDKGRRFVPGPRGPASRGRISSHSPMTTASTPSLRKVARGVVEPCGPTTTLVSLRCRERGESLLRHAQLGRSATPEQVARRCCHDGHIGRESRDLRPSSGDGRGPRAEHRRSRASCPASSEQRPGVAELQRQMRLAAAEIDAAFECPVRIDQRDTSLRGLRDAAAGTRRRPRAATMQSRESLCDTDLRLPSGRRGRICAVSET